MFPLIQHGVEAYVKLILKREILSAIEVFKMHMPDNSVQIVYAIKRLQRTCG